MVRFNGFRLLSIFLTPVTESERLNTERGSGIDLSGGQICVAMPWSFFLSDAIRMFLDILYQLTLATDAIIWT